VFRKRNRGAIGETKNDDAAVLVRWRDRCWTARGGAAARSMQTDAAARSRTVVHGRSERCEQREVGEGDACTAVGGAREKPVGDGGLSTNDDRRWCSGLVIPY
jgi:hypothetical protein